MAMAMGPTFSEPRASTPTRPRGGRAEAPGSAMPDTTVTAAGIRAAAGASAGLSDRTVSRDGLRDAATAAFSAALPSSAAASPLEASAYSNPTALRRGPPTGLEERAMPRNMTQTFGNKTAAFGTQGMLATADATSMLPVAAPALPATTALPAVDRPVQSSVLPVPPVAQAARTTPVAAVAQPSSAPALPAGDRTVPSRAEPVPALAAQAASALPVPAAAQLPSTTALPAVDRQSSALPVPALALPPPSTAPLPPSLRASGPPAPSSAGSLPARPPRALPPPLSVSGSSSRSSDELTETGSQSSMEVGGDDSDQRELKLGLGCVACILTLLEGIIVVYNVWDLNVFHMADLQSFGVQQVHYFSNAQRMLLKILGVGDLVMAFLGAFGFWSERNVLLALVFESLRGLHAQIATNCLKALLIWRVLVAFLAAPFLGITLAFQPTHMTWHYCLAFMYLAVSVGVAAALVAVLGVVTAESRLVQLEFELEDAMLRHKTNQDPGGKEPLILGKLPWGPCVFIWIAVIGAASFVWSVRLWMTKNCIIGGWAVFVMDLSVVSSTHRLEMAVYNLSWILAIVGISGIMMFNSALSLEALVRETLSGPQENPIVRRNLIWELERAITGKWQGTAAVCVFFVFSLLRVGFFFPITGMALFEKNICGFYIEALLRSHKSIPLFCTSEERSGLILLVVFFVLDLYQLSGLYKVWCHYYHQCQHPQEKLVNFSSYGPSYGATDFDEPPQSPELAVATMRSTTEVPLSPVPEEGGSSGREIDSPPPGVEGQDDDILNPNIAPLPVNFVLPLDSFRKMSAGIYPVPILSIGGDALLHARLPSTPVQGYAVGGRGAWLELVATERSRQPQASIGPLPRGVRKRRAAEIRGRAGESYGELTPVMGGWEVRRRDRTMLVLSSVDIQTMEISASLPDGSTIATTSARDNENLGLYVDAGNDTLLVLLCVLAVILMSPRPQMLLIKSARASASAGSGEVDSQA